MDIDLPSDTLEENQQLFSPQLLPHLPSRLTTTADAHEPVLNPLAYEGSPSLQEPSPPALVSNSVVSVVTKIEEVFESIADSILGREKELEIHLKSRSNQKPGSSNSNFNMDGTSKPRVRKIKFPSKCPTEAWRFAVLCRILELSHEALVTGVVTTKRDIFYRDPELFMKQSVVDRYVDDIAYTFGVNRNLLNVVAAAKGLVVGRLTVTKDNNARIEYWSEPEGMLIPKVDDLEEIYIGGTEWILVIEKEATFRTLAASEYWRKSMAGNGILITAKGYPDIQTRQFLHLLSIRFPRIPIFALVDFDPDGIGIMSTYKYGSKALSHETNITVPSIQWLGIRSSDFTTEDTAQGLLTLTKRDRNIAKKMLARQYLETADEDWRRELHMMLMLNMKAEIQILGNEKKLCKWLDSKLSSVVYNIDTDADGDILMS